MKKLIHVVGTRPNFIKLSSVVKALTTNFQNIILDTGQHYDDNMSTVFFRELNIPKPDFSLSIGSGTHGFQTGKGLIDIENIFLEQKPDGVVIYGDVNASLSGALAATKLDIPVFHIEAGGRSFDRTMPEEINRILIDNISDILFCNEESHAIQLEKEALPRGYVIGNTQVDSIYYIKDQLRPIIEGKYYLCTLHRPFNVDDTEYFNKILDKLNNFPHLVVFPAHPRIKNKILGNYSNIKLIEPQGFINFLSLIKYSQGVISDSGGIQCETAILRVPLLTLRPTTEHIATLDLNNTLVDLKQLKPSSFKINNYTIPEIWDGNASIRLKSILINYYENKQ